MGLMDTIKGLFKGREQQIKGGIDKVSDTIEKKMPQHSAKIDDLSDKAKGAVDKISPDEPAATAPGTSTAPSPAPAPPPPASSTPPPTGAPPSSPAT